MTSRPNDPVRRPLRATCLAAMGAMACLASVGCSVDDSSPRRNDPPIHRDEPIYRDEPGRPTNYPSDDRGEASIPRDAKLADSGSGNLRYTAPSDGRVWLRDAENRDTIIYTGKIYRGDDIFVEPAANRVSINGRKVLEYDLKKNHKHQLFFDRAEYGGRYGDRHDHGYDNRPRDRDDRY